MSVSPRWLITGGTGLLGGHVLRQLAAQTDGSAIATLVRSPRGSAGGIIELVADLRDATRLAEIVAQFEPTHVIHAAAMTAVDACWRDPQAADATNRAATVALAHAATRQGARFLFSSTDMVFAGDAAPYRESDAPKPLSCYGRSKAAAEEALAGLRNALVVRLPLLYGPPAAARETTFTRQIGALRAGQPLKLFADEFRTPLCAFDAAAALIALARSDVTGIMHVAGPQRLSRYELVQRFAALLQIETAKFEPVSRLSIDAAEPRPADLSLDGARFAEMFPAVRLMPVNRQALTPVGEDIPTA